MSWIDQAIAAFKFDIKAALHQGQSLSTALMKEAFLSGIPINVLVDWYGSSSKEKQKVVHKIYTAKHVCSICGNEVKEERKKKPDGSYNFYHRSKCKNCTAKLQRSKLKKDKK